jgi:hypothetical protein
MSVARPGLRAVWWAVLRVGAVGSLALASAACGLFDAPPPLPTAAPSNANLLANPGFEAGGEPWRVTGVRGLERAPLPFTDGAPYIGARSMELKVVGGETDQGTKATVAAQSVDPQAFPEFVSGFYRVDDWQPTARFVYLYFSITVHGGDFTDGAPTHELRVIIGAPVEPPQEPQVVYAFLSRAAPVLHRWTYVGFPVKSAFQAHVGQMPSRWDGIDIGMAVRFDGRDTHDPPVSAAVSFDDLYAGPQADNPNRPRDP